MADALGSKKFVDGVYIPVVLMIVGTLIVKREWTPYTVLVALALGSWKFFSLKIKKVLKPDVYQEFELKEKTIISHNVAIYRFSLPSPTSILGLPIGQHISIGEVLAQPDGTHKEIVRSYTPISGDHQPGYFDLLIKSYPTGNISKHMASLKVGQPIRVKGPKGAFVYTPNMVRHFGMIAGGTGITPMLQVVRAIIRGRAAGDTTQVDLIFANAPEGWTGGVGYVTADMITKWLPAAAPDVKLLLCGPPPMISGLKKTAVTLGFEKARPVSKLADQVFAF
ncbi:NADH-cytochrome b5 reductase [Verticillium dahliae VdLs.17]|uniref:cytochrome-b5 reductase n=1 Tax=Verticillium dahliae (strain VdLs.17 / ATCC MYA-4575 / FGSC 10137) TaxID=498257 RepID=G2X6Y6_VERDV|nr:NADH-cytochrome b5 reductase [Verticillium dahliae VdLs.17]EGY14754.1 NADH-cytochrome b5 reductase [Verticillium dahliae VdLs.17]